MATKKIKRTAGISRIDQPEKRTHGFFVRLRRKGIMYSAFFTDLRYGGKQRAFAAAQKHYRKLLKEHGQLSRRDWAEIPRRKTASGIIGVRKFVTVAGKRKRLYWQAVWSPKPYVTRRQLFSVQKYGNERAKAMAIQARRKGLKEMEV